ncbi:hypothetical protein ABK040_001917 [Willaertia magna]
MQRDTIHHFLSFLSTKDSIQAICNLSLTNKYLYKECNLLDNLFWKILLFDKYFHSTDIYNNNEWKERIEREIEPFGYKKCFAFFNLQLKTKYYRLITNNNSNGKYKFGIYGDRFVGKSTTVIRYVYNNFVEKYDPTIEDVFYKSVTIEDKVYNLEICDTAFTDYSYYLIYELNAFIFMCSINNVDSIGEIKEQMEYNAKYLQKNNYPYIICLNKCDLEEKDVTIEEIEQMLDYLIKRGTIQRKYKILLTSAKLNINIDEIFIELIKVCKESEIELLDLIELFLNEQKEIKQKEIKKKKSCFVQ